MPVTSTATQNPGTSSLVRHTARPRWGRAVLAWDRGRKRGYQFEDGQLRVFAEGYFHMFEAAAPSEDAASVLASLSATTVAGAAGGKAIQTPMLFEAQVGWLDENFEGGFAGAEWTKRHRGAETGRRLKRHRDALIAAAKEKLAAGVLMAGIDKGDWAFVVAQFVAVLAASDLVTKKQLAVLRDATPTERLARSLRDLLHGEGDFDERMRAAVITLCKEGAGKPSWPLFTAILAAWDPENHVFVRPSNMKEQAKVLGKRLKLDTVPRTSAYADCLSVARAAFESLAKRGHTPRDLFDVTDFMAATTKPSVRKTLMTPPTDPALH